MPVVDFTVTPTNSSTNSLTVDLPDAAAGELRVAWVWADHTGDDLATASAGWTKRGNGASSSNCGAVFEETTEGSNTLVVTSSSTNAMGAVAVTVDDVPASGRIDSVTIAGDTGGGDRWDYPRPTTSEDDELYLLFSLNDGNRNPQIEPGPMLMDQGYAQIGNTDFTASWAFKRTAGQIPQHYVWSTRDVDNCLMTVVCIKSDAGIEPPRADLAAPCMDPLTALNRQDADNTGYPRWTYEDPTSYLPATLDGKTIYYAAPNADAGAGVRPYQYTSRIGATIDDQIGLFCAKFAEFGTVDLTGEKLVLHAAAFGGNYFINMGKLADHGLIFGLGSSDSDYRFWDIPCRDTTPDASSVRPTIIDPSDTTNVFASGGSFDVTAVDRAFFGGLDAAITTAGMRAIFAQLHRVNTITLIGGDATLPAKVQHFKDIAESASILTVQNQSGQASGQYVAFQPIQIGGSEPVYFEDSGISLTFPPQAAADSKRRQFQDFSETIGLTIDVGATDTVMLTDSAISGEDEWTLTLDIHASASATLAGTIFSLVGNYTFTSVPAGVLDNTVYRGCDPFPAPTVAHSNVTIDAPLGSHGMRISASSESGLQDALDLLATYTFSNSGNAVGLELEYTGTSTSTLTLTAPNNVTSDKTAFRSAVANDLVITIGSSGSSFGTLSTAGSATGFSVSNDKTITLNIVDESGSAVSGCEVGLLERGTTTEVDHDNNTASGTYTYTYTYSSDTNIDIQVLKQGYEPYWDDTQTLGNADQSITVVLMSVPASQN